MPTAASDQDIGTSGGRASVDEFAERLHLLVVDFLADDAVVDGNAPAHAHGWRQPVLFQCGPFLRRRPAETLDSDARGLAAHLVKGHFGIEVPAEAGLPQTALGRDLGSGGCL